jgi:hypothetical protein
MNAETGYMSLADLASFNTDEIETLMSRVPDAGIFTVAGKEVTVSMTESEDGEKPPLFRINFLADILIAEPLDKKKDPESYVGRTLREGYALWPSDFSACIGLVKGRYKVVGLERDGALGGVEGQEPGWLDNMVSHKFRIRVRHGKRKDGQTQAYFDWLPLEDEEKEAA